MPGSVEGSEGKESLMTLLYQDVSWSAFKKVLSYELPAPFSNITRCSESLAVHAIKTPRRVSRVFVEDFGVRFGQMLGCQRNPVREISGSVDSVRNANLPAKV